MYKTKSKSIAALIIGILMLSIVLAAVHIELASAQATVALDKDWYHTGETVIVTVEDNGANTDPFRINSVTVTAESTDADGGPLDSIEVTLRETGVNTGEFNGTFRLVAENPGANDLVVEDGGDITVTYTDSGGIEYTDEATVDDTPPEVTNLNPARDAKINDYTPEVSASVDDAGSGISLAWLTLDGIVRAVSTTSGPISYTVPTVAPLAEGTHTVQVTAQDKAGNENVTIWSFTVDLTKPTCVISMNVSSPVKGEIAIEFLFTFNEDMDEALSVTIGGNATDHMTAEGSAGWKTSRIYSANYTVNASPAFNGTVVITGENAEDLAGNAMVSASFAFYIDNVDPSAPTGLSATTLPHSIVLTWNAASDAGSGVKLYNIYRNDTKIGSVLHPTTTFTDTGLMEEATFQYIVGAVDFAGNEKNSTAITVEFVPGVVTEWNITLSEGWNLISLPLIPENSSIEAVLSGIMEHVDSVWAYDAETGKWLMYDPDTPEVSNLDKMVDGVGYWIKMTAAATLTIHGSEFPAPPATPPVYHVVPGWNLIGYKEVVEMTANDYLAGVDYVRLWTFVDGRWVAVKGTDLMVPGRGYWIAVTEEGWIYP